MAAHAETIARAAATATNTAAAAVNSTTLILGTHDDANNLGIPNA